MTTAIESIVSGAVSLWWALAVGGSVLLLLAAGSARLLARAGAATRFVIWASAMAGLVTIAVGRLLLPTQTLPTSSSWLLRLQPPSWSASAAPRATATTTIDATRTPDGVLHISASNPTPSASGVVSTVSTALPATVTVSDAATPDLASRSPMWALWLCGVWITGALIVAWRFVRGTLQVRRQVRAAPRNLDGRHWTLLQHLSDAMAVQRPVALRWVDDDQIPVTTGIVHPVILLPRAATTWPLARLRIVLQHELAHIARYDLALATVAQITLVMCWWHPLAWRALQMMERERELACDDFVLASGVSAVDYADELLHVVRELRTPAPFAFAALGMARTSQVESRVRAMLNPLTSRRRAHRTLVLAATLGAVALIPCGRIVPVARAAMVQPPAITQPVVSSRAGSSTATMPPVALPPVAVPPLVVPPYTPPPSGIPSGGPTIGVNAGVTDDPIPQHPDEYNFGGDCSPKAGSVSISRISDDSTQQYYRVDKTGCVRLSLRGRVTLDDRDQLQGFTGNASRLVIEQSDTRVTRRLTAVDAGAVPQVEFLRDGRPVSAAESAAWAQAMYVMAARDVGLDAAHRVDRLLRDGGVDALEREIRAMRADDIMERYYRLALLNPRVRGAELGTLIVSAELFASKSDRGVQRRMQTEIAAARGRQ